MTYSNVRPILFFLLRFLLVYFALSLAYSYFFRSTHIKPETQLPFG